MRRLQAEIASVICVMVLSLSVPVLAQESAQEKKPAAQTTASKERHGIWKKVADGIWEAKVRRFEKEEPEFAVLRLSAERYAEFQKDRKAFLNQHKIFDKDVRKQERCTETKPQTEGGDGKYWYAILSHYPGSAAACDAYAGWSEPKDSD